MPAVLVNTGTVLAGSLIGILLFMAMDKSREFDADAYLYSQIRLYVFIPYLIAMLLCISTAAETASEAWFSFGAGAPKTTIMPSPRNSIRVPR